MDLQISVFLLLVLFTAGHSLSCYECLGEFGSCAGQTVQTCPSRFSKCVSLTTATLMEGVSFKTNGKGCAVDCASGSMSQSLSKLSSVCCNSDKCNAQDAPDASKVSNGKKCYSCDGKSCSNLLSCSENEDHCFKAKVSYKEMTAVVKGCVSKSICNSPDFIPSLSEVSCCEGYLCNSAKSFTHSFLFLCCSLLCFILLH